MKMKILTDENESPPDGDICRDFVWWNKQDFGKIIAPREGGEPENREIKLPR